MSKDYYSILGVSKSATADEIKKAFYKLAHQHHPDKKGGDEKKFKEANEAYQVLSNPEKRKQYDQFGSDFANGGFNGGGAGGFSGANWQDIFRQGGFSSQDADFGDLGDIFGDVFSAFGGGTRSGRGRKKRGNDIEADLTIEFREAVFGAEKSFELYKTVVCSHCHGNGAEPGTKISSCATCGGRGQVEQVQRTILGAFKTVGVCPDCGGEGKTAEKKCTRCSGHGAVKDKDLITVKVPAGIDNGQSIKITGRGEAGEKGAIAGDLYLRIKVRPDAKFKREGDNITSREFIPFSLAALGGKIDVATVDGAVKMKIPEGTQSGKVFVLHDHGAPRLHRGGRGDQFVEVLVETPTKLSRQQKKLIEELGREGV